LEVIGYWLLVIGRASITNNGMVHKEEIVLYKSIMSLLKELDAEEQRSRDYSREIRVNSCNSWLLSVDSIMNCHSEPFGTLRAGLVFGVRNPTLWEQ
jgi:hypothetical protein